MDALLLDEQEDFRNIMWSHYAAKHSSMVIGFEQFSKLIDVNYSAEWVKMDLSEPVGSEYDEVLGQTIVSTKHIDWGYEQEGRLLVVWLRRTDGKDQP